MVEVDRLSPRNRPNERPVMYQSWRDLLFLHWEVEAEAMQKLLPPGLAIDTYDGKAYVGLVPFTMTGVRPTWSPSVPGISNFHECNVRTYVHHNGENPGVFFFSLDAANLLAVNIARAVWKLPYFYADMMLAKSSGTIDYSSLRRGVRPGAASLNTTYSFSAGTTHAEPGSLDYFLIERYYLYTFTNKLLIGQVHHPPYPLQSAVVSSLEENLVAAAGIDRGIEAPVVHYSPGVDVAVFRLREAWGLQGGRWLP